MFKNWEYHGPLIKTLFCEQYTIEYILSARVFRDHQSQIPGAHLRTPRGSTNPNKEPHAYRMAHSQPPVKDCGLCE